MFFFLQILVLYEKLDTLNVESVVGFIKGLQRPDGSFMGDQWGEYLHNILEDSHFIFSSFILKKPHPFILTNPTHHR